MSGSTRGLGRNPLKVETAVQIRYRVPYTGVDSGHHRCYSRRADCSGLSKGLQLHLGSRGGTEYTLRSKRSPRG